ncbi:MAG TPA: xanthine dehydrogenase family protein subunit M [Acidobacteriaceae bacterium]|jgi:xanthine dehydrogenase YagS FAD-binding subunit|nr:xanthine dehydrogenase family protein subunit M [Acidobacteriaceae bacterium]
MEQFSFVSATDDAQATAAAAKSATAQMGATVRFVAGGTNLVDLMKLDVERPRQVVDINGLRMDRIEALPEGGLRLGALTRNSDVANHAVVQRDYAVLSQAILSGASPQIRNMATTAGNLLQRTRCVYFRDLAHRCNKREPGSGCDAIGGYNRMMAILGTSEHCIASNPSDQNVALMALEAMVHIQGVRGERSVAIGEFYRLPGETPNIETVLEPGDLITSVRLPAPVEGTRSLYLKLRDRAAYEFALASAAVVLGVSGGTVRHARVALGGVGTIPWRAREAEAELEGKPADRIHFVRAAEAALKNARPQSENGFKVELAKRCLVHALTTVSA